MQWCFKWFWSIVGWFCRCGTGRCRELTVYVEVELMIQEPGITSTLSYGTIFFNIEVVAIYLLICSGWEILLYMQNNYYSTVCIRLFTSKSYLAFYCIMKEGVISYNYSQTHFYLIPFSTSVCPIRHSLNRHWWMAHYKFSSIGVLEWKILKT